MNCCTTGTSVWKVTAVQRLFEFFWILFTVFYVWKTSPWLQTTSHLLVCGRTCRAVHNTQVPSGWQQLWEIFSLFAILRAVAQFSVMSTSWYVLGIWLSRGERDRVSETAVWRRQRIFEKRKQSSGEEKRASVNISQLHHVKIEEEHKNVHG